MSRQHDEGLKYWFAPRENEKPFTESERAQRWRLSLASLLFITVLLSDHLWFCAEAKLTRTRDKGPGASFAFTDMGKYPNPLRMPTSPDPRRLTREEDVIFIGNSTKPLWRMETCHPDSVSKDCFTFTDAQTVCLALFGAGEEGTQSAYVNLSDLYLSFCNSYSLLDLFYGFTSPDLMNCTLDAATGGDVLGCRECVRAYQRLDQLAEETYREFELLVQKYETDAYSVRTCMDECKVGPSEAGSRSLTKPRTCTEGGGFTVVIVTSEQICHYTCNSSQEFSLPVCSHSLWRFARRPLLFFLLLLPVVHFVHFCCFTTVFHHIYELGLQK